MEQPTPKRAWSRPDTRPLTSADSRADVQDVAKQNSPGVLISGGATD